MINNPTLMFGRCVRHTVLVASLLILCMGLVYGQYSSNSLYSIYGIGDLVPNSFAKQSGLGRAGTALKSDGFINTLNPASFTGHSTHDVILDMGLSFYLSEYESRGKYETATDGNLDHFSFGFPLTRWWRASAGLTPFSSVGYDIATTSLYEGSSSRINTEFTGSGGINQFYFANSFSLTTHLSIGVNLAYLMGSLDQTEITHLVGLGYSDVHTTNSYYLRNLYVGFGLLYDQQFNNDNLSLGITYHPRQRLVANYTHKITVPGDEEVTLVDETVSAQSFYVPGAIRAGLAYDINSKFRFVGDYSIQKWSGNSSLFKIISFTDRYSYNFGFEYLPNPVNPANLFQRIEYRVGAYCENSYIKLRGNQIKDLGLTIGWGIPLWNQKSMINFSLELGQLGTLNDGLVKERYAGFSLDFVLYDTWFVKKKFQ
jgi:hypothetical protein